MFLQASELDSTIYPEVKQAISRGQTDIVNLHINEATALIQSRLIKKYDIVPELQKTGNDRHPLLLKYCKDIAIYFLYDQAESIPAKRVKAYDDAIVWLKDLASGQAVLAGVPDAPVEETATPATNAQFGSTEKRNNNDW